MMLLIGIILLFLAGTINGVFWSEELKDALGISKATLKDWSDMKGGN